MNTASPLGRYGELVAAMAAGLVVLAWIVGQLSILGATSTPALDNAAVLVLGVLLGQRATTNGAAKLAAAAHTRLDELGAKPAAAAYGSRPDLV